MHPSRPINPTPTTPVVLTDAFRCVLAQREAWLAGRAGAIRHVVGGYSLAMRREARRRYPLPGQPRTVVVDTASGNPREVEYRPAEDRFYDRSASPGASFSPGAILETAAAVRAAAALVERPYLVLTDDEEATYEAAYRAEVAPTEPATPDPRCVP